MIRRQEPNVITPVQAICFAERSALLSGDDVDFVMNIFAPWTGVRRGELMAVEGWDGEESPLQLPDPGRPGNRQGRDRLVAGQQATVW